jgi:hypothetical protein
MVGCCATRSQHEPKEPPHGHEQVDPHAAREIGADRAARTCREDRQLLAERPKITSDRARRLRRVLQCIECDRASDEGIGWRGYLTADDLDEGEIAEVVIYCPFCAVREFGPIHRRGNHSRF